MRINFEQRAFTRVPINRTAEIHIDGTAVLGATRNLSACGVFLESPVPLPVGAHCRVRLPLNGVPGRGAIEAAGRVVRSDATGLAVSFAAMDLNNFHHLRNLVLFHAPDPARVAAEFEQHIGPRHLD